MSRRRQRGEGSIRPYETRGGTRFLCEWYEPIDPDDPEAGLRRRSKGGFLTQKDAAAALRAELTAVAEGRVTRSDEMTVAQYAREWLAGVRLAETTRAGYSKALRLHVIPYIGDRRLGDLRPAHLAKLYRDLENRGRADGTGGLGPNTILKVHVVIGTILQAAVADNLIVQNVARSPRANPPSAREVRSRQVEVEPWTVEQADRFLAWSRSHHSMHPAWLTIAYTGLRRSELLGLQWADVDLNSALVRVRRGVTVVKEKGTPQRLVIGPPKSGRERTIDIDDETVVTLREWRVTVAKLGFERVAGTAWVFAGRYGGPRQPEGFSRLWRDAVQRARRDLAASLPPNVDIDTVLPYTHVHGLRHAHASHLLEAGEPVKIVQERLGHASPTITHNIYNHLTPTAQKHAVNRLAARRLSARQDPASDAAN